MKQVSDKVSSPRRTFLNAIATGAATLGIASFVLPGKIAARSFNPFEKNISNLTDPDLWFSQLKGKHRIVYDVTQPHGVFPFAWPRVFMLTNMKTGATLADCGVVVVLRHDAICYAFEDSLWSKYHFGEVFKAEDPKTKAPSLRNPFWKPAPGDFKVPGVGDVAIGINELQSDGVMFCVCEMAITVYSTAVADGMKLNAEEVRKEWVNGLLPDIQPVPSGVWALGRAQENGCGYIFAG